MKTESRVLFIVVGLCMTIVFCDLVRSQESAAEKKTTSPEKKSAVEEFLNPPDPAVAAIMTAKLSTPAEFAQAAKALADLKHFEEARQFLRKILDAKLDQQRLAELGEQFGSLMFLTMAGQKELLPEAKDVADAVTAALTAKVTDLTRINDLIAQLQATEAEKRMEAFKGLLAAGRVAIGPLVSVLADSSRAVEHENVRTVLSQMGRDARETLAVLVDSAEPSLKVQAILTLGEMNNSQAVLDLLWAAVFEQNGLEVCQAATAAIKKLGGSVPTKAAVVQQLTIAAREYFDGRRTVEGAVNGHVEVCRWNKEKKQCIFRNVTAAEASRLKALRLAHQAWQLAPQDRELRLLYATTLLDTAAYENGLDTPLPEKHPAVVEVESQGVDFVERILEFALSQNHSAAAAASARILGQIGTAEKLLRQSEKPAPLALAAQNSNRRVQLAAVEAIVNLRASKPFSGSSYLTSTLGFLAANSGVRRALVAAPNAGQARELGNMLASVGLEATTTTTGNELLRLAALSPEYELVLVDVTIDRPTIDMLLQALRHDWRTASLRVGLIARDGYLDLAEKTAAGDPLAMAFSWPRDDKAVQWQVERLATLRPDEFIPSDVRLQQAATALDLLAQLGGMSSRLYDLRRAKDAVLIALYNMQLTAKAAIVLAELNAPEAQRALADFASRATFPVDLRKTTAAAFCRNVEKHGILLTTEEIRRQYNRFESSADDDPESQQILKSILECLKKRADKE